MDTTNFLILFASITVGSVVGIIVFYVLLAVAEWKIFAKAGEAGWKGLIPFYSTYVQYRLTWKTKMFWILLAVEIVSGILQNVSDSLLATFLAAVLSIVGLVIIIMGQHKLSKSFGHGAGFTVGLVFLSPIFLLILGFGSSQYQGNLSWPNQARL